LSPEPSNETDANRYRRYGGRTRRCAELSYEGGATYAQWVAECFCNDKSSDNLNHHWEALASRLQCHKFTACFERAIHRSHDYPDNGSFDHFVNGSLDHA
jgi:hypothetical protein